MTQVGKGGVQISTVTPTKRFKKDFQKLPQDVQGKFEDKIKDLKSNPMPRGLRFEKLQRHNKPAIYTFHIDGDHKVSLTIDGNEATLRRTGKHKAIDRQPQ